MGFIVMENANLLIEKVTVENFGPFAGKQELVFPIDEQKKINVIVGGNAVGKTQLFEAILWCLFGKRVQVMYQGEEELFLNKSIARDLHDGQSATAKVEVVLNIDKKSQTVSREIQFKKTNGTIDIDSTNVQNENLVSTLPPSHFIFVNDEKIGSILETYNQEKDKDSENLKKIVDKMNSIYQKSSLIYIKNFKFQIIDNKIQLVENGFSKTLAASETAIINCMFLSAIKEILFPNSVLILDAAFSRLSKDLVPQICNFMMSSIPQLIFLITPTEYHLQFSEKIGIDYELIRNQETSITSIKRIE